jgi:predicted nucleic acid-binding protein
MFVLDCSVTMSWCFEEESENDIYAEHILKRLEREDAVVPRLWHLEVLNVLLASERRRRITSQQSDSFLEYLSLLPIRTDSMPVTIQDHEVLALARKYQLSSYDTAYLALAVGEGLQIATKDRGLIAAAKALDAWLD